MRFLLTSFLLIAFIASTATAQVDTSPRTPEQKFVYQLAEDVLATIEENSADDRALKKEFRIIFDKYIDIDWVGRFVLGKHWRSASSKQKQRFSESYRKFMINSYTNRLREYSGEHYQVFPPRDMGNNRSTLTMEIFQNSGGAPIKVDYKIRPNNETYKIYDIVVEGVSLISTQRSEFNSVVSRKGLDYLIKALERKKS